MDTSSTFILVLTAHDNVQADTYRRALARRSQLNLIDRSISSVVVIPDPVDKGVDGRKNMRKKERPGPGGATCHALGVIFSMLDNPNDVIVMAKASSSISNNNNNNNNNNEKGANITDNVNEGEDDGCDECNLHGKVPVFSLDHCNNINNININNQNNNTNTMPLLCATCGCFTAIARFHSADAKILLVHGGGYSSRLPNHSVSGKLLAPFPRAVASTDDDNENNYIGRDGVMTLLDAKVDTLAPFLSSAHTPPGCFVAASDDVIIPYAASSNGDNSDGDATNIKGMRIPRTGFTALAHPSSLDVAEGHGVFVLNEMDGAGDEMERDRGIHIARVKSFPHKCGAVGLREMGATFSFKEDKDKKNKNDDISINTDELAWTDSAFFIAMPTARRIVDVHADTSGFYATEIDCYSDFLQCSSGHPKTQHDDDHEDDGADAGDVWNLSSTKRRAIVRSQIRAALCSDDDDKDHHHHPLHAIVLPRSRFYHLGTMPEYVSHLTGTGTDFLRDTGCDRVISSYIDPTASIAENSCLMGSRIGSEATIAPRCVVEFSEIGSNWKIDEGCILSGVILPPLCSPSPARTVPSGTFLHTVTLKGLHAVTHVLGTSDNIKGSDTILGVPLDVAEERLGISTSAASFWAGSSEMARDLFHARIFPAVPIGDTDNNNNIDNSDIGNDSKDNSNSDRNNNDKNGSLPQKLSSELVSLTLARVIHGEIRLEECGDNISKLFAHGDRVSLAASITLAAAI